MRSPVVPASSSCCDSAMPSCGGYPQSALAQPLPAELLCAVCGRIARDAVTACTGQTRCKPSPRHSLAKHGRLQGATCAAAAAHPRCQRVVRLAARRAWTRRSPTCWRGRWLLLHRRAVQR